MSHNAADYPHRSMSIGLIAYGVDGPNASLVFVRVPTERGRWVLTDRCVVEVPCSRCGASIGEPCRRNWGRSSTTQPVTHGAGTHCDRRDNWQRTKHRHHDPRSQPKLRIPAADLAAAQESMP